MFVQNSEGGSEWEQLHRADVKNQDFYMPLQNKLGTITSPPMIFLFILFVSNRRIPADFFLLEINVEPTLTPTLFENEETFDSQEELITNH